MIPRAETLVHGVGGHAVRASARVRVVARRAGQWSLGLAKVALWLLVVTSSLTVIAILTSRGVGEARHGLHDTDANTR